MKYLLSIILTIGLQFSSSALASPLELNIDPSAIQSQSNSYYYYNFGSVRINWSQYVDLYLRNTGHTPLYIQAIYISGVAFWAWSQCPDYLMPGQSCRTTVEFHPWMEGSYSGSLRFMFPNGNILADLFGWGVRY